ncbi:MAG: dihydropteroate synthase [Firmicutes bacterium]|nr:dihydropteroate synthase [Bacillota bacterium]
MAIKNLTIIGESINDSVPSTHQLFEAGDLDGLKALAKTQDEKGAAYIDVNIGKRPPELMAQLVRELQTVTAKPLSIDSPDPEIAAAGLKAYDPAKAGGKLPILNSISPLRLSMIDLYRIQPFMPILLVSERVENGQSLPTRTGAETLQAARDLVRRLREKGYPLPAAQIIIDPGIAPIGSDMEGNLKRALESIRLIHEAPDLKEAHFSVGLSNFTVMLPSKRPDGSPVKSALESAFLTKAMPLGLDMVIGSVKRNYEILSPGHPALACIEACLDLDGFDSIIRVKEFYS